MYDYANILRGVTWPESRLSEAVEWLARSHSLVPPGRRGVYDLASASGLDQQDWQQIIGLVTARLGFEAEPVSCTYRGLEGFFRAAAPAIIAMPAAHEGGRPGFLVLKRSGRRKCAVFSPDLRVVNIDTKTLADAFRSPLSVEYQVAAKNLLDMAKISAERQNRVSQALVESWLGGEMIQIGWLLRASPGAGLPVLIRQSKIIPEMIGWLATYIIQSALFLLSWWLIGRVVLDGQTDRGWIWTWTLLLVSIVPVQMISTWMQQRFSESMGVIFKQRLLYGALKMNPDSLRTLGAGQMLDRVMEAESVETLALGSGLTALISIIQLGVAAWVLSQGPGGLLSVAALTLWLAAILAAGWFNYQSGRQWTDFYRTMTNNLVEKMVGHRTRLAQEDPQHRHEEEDIELEQYQSLSQQFSRTGAFLSSLPASWLVAGLACLIPSFLSDSPAKLPGMALGLGGVMLAHQAFGVVQAGIQNILMLLLGWKQVGPVFEAAAAPETSPSVLISTRANERSVSSHPESDSKSPLITLRDVSFRFSPQRRPALDRCHLDIFSGDRLLLQGPSGGGKTTLGAILAGLRKPDSGLLFLHGYDWHSLGENAWRSRVVMAPQFHENHIFNETFGFNLLMGRRWPPQPEDIQAAEVICRELGLGELLGRMPSGWQQIVGENGWQLSHGERSRVFIARALLQNADLVIMDESFGALDPENLYLALDCAQKRAASLVVIAHP